MNTCFPIVFLLSIPSPVKARVENSTPGYRGSGWVGLGDSQGLAEKERMPVKTQAKATKSVLPGHTEVIRSLKTHRGDQGLSAHTDAIKVCLGHNEMTESLGKHQGTSKSGHCKAIGVGVGKHRGRVQILRGFTVQVGPGEAQSTQQCLKHEVTQFCQPLLAAGQDTKICLHETQ